MAYMNNTAASIAVIAKGILFSMSGFTLRIIPITAKVIIVIINNSMNILSFHLYCFFLNKI